jgi:hypothetical protein
MVSVPFLARMVFILFAFLWAGLVHAADKGRQPSSTMVFASQNLKLRSIAVDSHNLVPKSFSVNARKRTSYSRIPAVRAQTESVVAPQSMRKNFMYN